MATKKVQPPPEKLLRTSIERDDKNWLYLVDRKCNIIRMERGVPKARTEVLLETELKREKGFMYYLDDEGDLVRKKDSGR